MKSLPQNPPLPLEVVELLREMGLSASEIRAYQYLLRNGPALSSDIARETGQPRGRIYQSMRELVGKGFVGEKATRPIQFFATPLPEILKAATARLKRHLDAAAKAEQLYENVAPAPAAPAARPMRLRDVRVFAGRKACVAQVARSVGRAHQFLWIMGGSNFGNRLTNMPRFQEHLRRCIDRGVDVRILLPAIVNPTPAAMALQVALGSHITYVRGIEALGPVTVCASESGYMEVVAQPDDSAPNRGDDVGFEVSSPAYVEVARQRFDWALRAFSRSASGAAAVQDDTSALERALMQAREEVVVFGPSGQEAEPWAWPASMSRLARARGVRLRAVTPALPDPAASASGWELRVAENAPKPVAVVDGRLLLQPESATDVSWRESEDPAAVLTYKRLFEDLWSRGAEVASGSAEPSMEAAPAASATARVQEPGAEEGGG